MESAKTKILIYFLVISFVVSILGMSIMKVSVPGKSAPVAVSDAHKLEALVKSAPQSPEMIKFIENEKTSEATKQEVFADAH